MKKSLPSFRGRPGQAGFSLIELMISIVIGMVVVGAVLAAYLGAGKSSRASRAMAQITEDASIAMNVMRSSIAMVGYGRPTGLVGSKFTKAYNGQGMFGCDAAFQTPTDAIAALTCSAAAGPDSIAVAYEAEKDNSVVGADGRPLDCLGNALSLDATGTYYLAYNRFYVSGGQLMCMGPGSGTPQALVDNVADMQIRYGVANVGALNQVARYETGTSLQAALGAPGWGQTVSVRVCVVVRSTDNVLDQKLTYEGCSGQVTPADGDLRMYRAFTTTIVMQNRLGNMR